MLNSIDELKRIVLKWFEYYKEMGDEMAVQMFFDDLEVVDYYARALYDQGLVSAEEYIRFLNFTEELLDELKKIAGIERIDMSFW